MMFKIILYSIFFIFFQNFVIAQKEIDILYTSNTNGALENCRCPNKALGSLEKRKHFIDQWYKNKPGTLFLDSGDFLSAKRNELKDSIAFKIYEMFHLLRSKQTFLMIFNAWLNSFFFTFNGGKILTTFSAARIVRSLLSINAFIKFV